MSIYRHISTYIDEIETCTDIYWHISAYIDEISTRYRHMSAHISIYRTRQVMLDKFGYVHVASSPDGSKSFEKYVLEDKKLYIGPGRPLGFAVLPHFEGLAGSRSLART